MSAAAGLATGAPPRWQPAYVGVGSNLDGPQERVRRALDALAQLPASRVVVSSPLYRTAPLVKSRARPRSRPTSTPWPGCSRCCRPRDCWPRCGVSS